MEEDFGKILKQWENNQSGSAARPAPTESAPTERAPAGEARAKRMDEWLDQYPPGDELISEKEKAQSADTGRASPEKTKVDDTIDLHGYRLEEALAVTTLFIDRSVESGFRKVVIIHGKGENGQGVLRREIRAYLEQHPMTGAMGHGRGVEGGRGALWVMLRSK